MRPSGQLRLASTCSLVPVKSISSSSPRIVRARLDRDRLGIVPEAVDVVDGLVPPVRRATRSPARIARSAVLLEALEVGAEVASPCRSTSCARPRSPARHAATCAWRSPSTWVGWRVFFSMMRRRVWFSTPAVVELEERQAKALLEDLGRVDGDASGRDAADVGVVGERRRVPLELVVDEDRLDHVDVGQVLPAVAVRVVGDEDVSRTRRLGVLLAEVAHHRREAPELHREREALRDEPAVAVAEGGGVVHRVPDDRRVRAPHQDERHLVRRRRERVANDLERDRVEPLVSRHGRSPPRCRSRRAGRSTPAGRRSWSRTRRRGTARVARRRATRLASRTGVATVPWRVPKYASLSPTTRVEREAISGSGS